MIVTIQTIEQVHSEGAGDYLKVTGIDTKTQKPTTKIVFNHYGETNLMDKWHLLQEGKTVELKMVQTYKEGKPNWNVADIKEPELPPAKEPESLPEQMKAPVDEALKAVPPKPIIAEAKDRDGLPLSVKIRTFTVSYAKDLATNGLIAPDEILSYAKAFEGYIWSHLTIKDDDVFRRAISHAKFEAH